MDKMSSNMHRLLLAVPAAVECAKSQVVAAPGLSETDLWPLPVQAYVHRPGPMSWKSYQHNMALFRHIKRTYQVYSIRTPAPRDDVLDIGSLGSERGQFAML